MCSCPQLFIKENNIAVISLLLFRSIVFEVGRRGCQGEVLAKNRIFLFLSTFMQKFHFLPAEGADAPKYDPRDYGPGLTILPVDYKIYAIQREK